MSRSIDQIIASEDLSLSNEFVLRNKNMQLPVSADYCSNMRLRQESTCL